MSDETRALADRLLQAFARSDVAEIDALCADDVILVGTDEGERWHGKAAVLAGFEGGTYDLAVAWVGEPQLCGQAVVGDARFTLPGGATQDARVTLVFEDGRCVHGHYSVVQTVDAAT
jgi:ketosteroid isomerase-like protein